MEVDISIGITNHREGIVAHKTVLSLLRAAEELEKNEVRYEVLIGLDNPDSATEEYFRRWENDERFRVIECSFGNPADNRNNLVQQAAGNYVSLIDGDDLVSSNWLIDAYGALRAHPDNRVVFHPAAHLMFGFDEPHETLWLMMDSFSKEEDLLSLAYWNRWTGAFFAAREIFLQHPFKHAKDGFGFEDYLFNCDTREADILHRVVPQTTLFYRRRAGSTTHEHRNAVLAYSELFNTDYVRTIEIPAPTHLKQGISLRSVFGAGARLAFRAAKKILSANKYLYEKIGSKVYETLSKRNMQKVPPFLLEQWRDINSIENQLYPTVESGRELGFHPLSFDQHEISGGIAYASLIQQTTKDPDYLFLVPELSGHGGTEKLIGNYCRAIKKAHPAWHIAVVSSSPMTEEMQSCAFFPKDIDLIDFGAIANGRTPYEKGIIWSRFLIQIKCKRLHIINEEEWCRWASDHKTLLEKNNYKVYVSLFMKEYVSERDRTRTFADPWLGEMWSVVSKVFTDNRNVIDEALMNNAFDEERMMVHYQPEVFHDLIPPKTIETSRPLRILWAGRIAQQKRVDILREVANGLESANFCIDAYGHFHPAVKRNYFKGSNVNYKGIFSGGMRTLPLEEYDVYLYTSQTDGMPNILLEAVACGLPVVASNAGGVKELVKNNETGFLVEDLEDIEGYIVALKSIAEDPPMAKMLAENAQKLLILQHGLAEFEKKVARDIS